jgi:hypothetical protein
VAQRGCVAPGKAIVRRGEGVEGRLSGHEWCGMEGHTVVCVRWCSRTRIYTGSGRHLIGPQRRRCRGWLSPTQIFCSRQDGRFPHWLAPLSNATAPVDILDLTPPYSLQTNPTCQNFLYRKNAKREACPKAPSQQLAATCQQIINYF